MSFAATSFALLGPIRSRSDHCENPCFLAYFSAFSDVT